MAKFKKIKKATPAQLAAVYYTPSHPSSFRNAYWLSKAVPGATEKQALEWLQTQENYTLLRNARKTLIRDAIIVQGIDSHWEADLIDMQELSNLNKGFKYMLTVIDVLSKYAWVVPMKNKTAAVTAAAFSQIFAKGRVPRNLRTDAGKEFENQTVQNLLKKRSINFYTARNRTKAAVVERFNKTLKTKMWKYFHATNKKRYIDVLEDLVKSYNASIHSVTKMAPKDVTPYNAEKVWRRMYGHLLTYRKDKPPKFKVGDLVRIARQKGTFEKGYKDSWVNEFFTIHNVLANRLGRDRYVLHDEHDEPIIGTFKEEELQKVKKGPAKQIKATVRRTATQKAVRYRGYPDSLVTWIDLK